MSTTGNFDLLSLDMDANDSAGIPSSTIETVSHAKLAQFWRHSPKEWFVHAESVFEKFRIRSDTSRKTHVLSALDEDGIKTVRDLVGTDAKYDDVKNRLISTYTASQSTRFRTITQPGGIEDRRLTQLLRDLRAVLLEGTG